MTLDQTQDTAVAVEPQPVFVFVVDADLAHVGGGSGCVNY